MNALKNTTNVDTELSQVNLTITPQGVKTTVNTRDLGRLIEGMASQNISKWHEDLFTDADGNTYGDDEGEYKVSEDPRIAALVDAANVLKWGELARVKVQ